MADISPLAEASPESLDELFSRDPLKLADSDINKIVEALRAQRVRWMAAEAVKQPREKKSSTPKNAAPSNLSLGDLGL